MKEKLLERLKEDCYKKGDYTLSSGQKSEHYVNCKPVTLTGHGLTITAMMLLEHVETPVVAGLTLGADPLVSGVAVCSALDGRLVDALIVRKEPKGHGTEAWIEGPKYPEGTKVTVLEDVTTTGASAVKAAEKLRDAGYIVERVVTVVDRQEGAIEALAAADLELRRLFTIDDLV
jgi:orotate phosphoribosyltransferase|tara:strand:+ start:96 stop:620 length:525 start_codon:yes stop_codon:yes gene_type:complete